MNEDLHYLGFEMPGLTVSFHRVDLGLDQPIINAEIPLHQWYLTKSSTSLYRKTPKMPFIST
jgi:hypothetical protein